MTDLVTPDTARRLTPSSNAGMSSLSPPISTARFRARLQAGCGLVIAALCVAVLASTTVHAQRASPHETVRAVVDGATISIAYGRPFAKGRKVIGGVVPYGQIWRLGADEATTLVTDRPLTIGTLRLPAGSYTLFALPTDTQWTLIVNRQTGQSGLDYDQRRDVGRVPMRLTQSAAPIEQLTIAVLDTAAGGELKMTWERADLTVPFSVAGS